jgi:hypothetical protein
MSLMELLTNIQRVILEHPFISLFCLFLLLNDIGIVVFLSIAFYMFIKNHF